ncbi:MAG: hypothetical protein MI674_05435, partial [Cytophagales bacterium]|nr:hypothetical protein [Cytophagales bacterium]
MNPFRRASQQNNFIEIMILCKSKGGIASNFLTGKGVFSTLPYRNPELRTQNPELRTQNPKLRTQNPELGTRNSELGTQNPELRTR